MRQIFVFGSNREGRHGKGAALCALEDHKAIYGQARGLQGDSYAIVTKELRRDHPYVTVTEVGQQIKDLIEFATEHPDWIFNVTPIGCGLAGFSVSQIAPLFKRVPENMKLPTEFREFLATYEASDLP